MLTLWYLQKSTFCPITLFQLVRFEKFLWKQWIFIQMIILSTNNYLLSLELNVLSYNSVWSWQNWKIPSETGVVFSRQSFWVPTTQCYLQHWTFHPMFMFISILFGLCLHGPYFFLFKCNFDSFEWQFGTYFFYVDLETSSKIKLICLPTHYYWSIQFSAVNSVLF